MKDTYAYVKDFSPLIVKKFKSNLTGESKGSFVYEWKLLLKHNIRIVKIVYYSGSPRLDLDYIKKRYNIQLSYHWYLNDDGDGVEKVFIMEKSKGNII